VNELRDFLRARRARILPEEVGMPSHGRRRVPGLRREELSRLAGVSVDYYTQLEQGRDIRPSEQVLDALARALSLDESERAHLHRLARRSPLPPAEPESVRAGLWELVDSVGHPAIVLGRCLDVLAWNRLACALIADFPALPESERNIVRLLFLDARVRALYADWDEVAADAVAHLRAAASEREDARLAALVGELTLKSETFAALWARHDVRPKTHGTKRFNHPAAGRLVLDFETLTVPGTAQSLVIYRPA
jgi:transcriptional regulator with XRE-family HTH domain